MKNLIKVVIITISAVSVMNKVIAANCPDFESIYINQTWSNFDSWSNLPGYLKGSFSGLNKVIVTQTNSGTVATCFYHALDSNSSRVYRRAYNEGSFNGDSAFWKQIGEGRYACEPQSANHYADCSYSLS